MQLGHQDERSAGIGEYDRAAAAANSALALAYVGAGIPVLPCAAAGPGQKRPLTPCGHHDASADPLAIECWWHRWPDALVGIPTGAGSGVWVLDVDGEAGHRSLQGLLPRLGADALADLTRCVSRTPSGGLHLVFRLRPGERPRNRARDIGAGLDTRGVKADGASAGYFIAAGSILPDGKRYELADATTLEPIERTGEPFAGAAPAPRGLLYLASFNSAERAVIAASNELRGAIQASPAAEWPAIVEQHCAAQREALAAHSGQRLKASTAAPESERQLGYVVAILDSELRALAGMGKGSGRNNAAYRLTCRVGRWAHHGIIARDRLVAAVLDACQRNGLVAEDGPRAVLATIESGLAASVHDTLPELEART